MYGIFMESVVILKLYTGLRYLAPLYLAGLIYLLITEKEKRIRTLIVYVPMAILAVYLCPLFRWFFVWMDQGGETYYRVLWLLPMGITITYAGCRLFAAHKRIGLIVMSLAVMLGGTYVYNSQYISKAENLYHIPQTVVAVCDYLKENEETDYIQAVFPEELVHFVRQYDADIGMPYGRSMLVPQWGYYNAVHEAMEKSEVIDVEALLEATRATLCNYVILHENQPLSDDPATYRMELMSNIDGYLIYKDVEVEQIIIEEYLPYM